MQQTALDDMEDDMPAPADYLEAARQHIANTRNTRQGMFERAKAANQPTDRAERLYSEKCGQCAGSGNWRPGYPCFKCNGKGVLTFKTSPEARRSSRDSAANAKVRKAQEIAANVAAFKEQYPEIEAWWTNTQFEFAISLREALHTYGQLSEKQLAAALKCVAALEAKKAERKAEQAAREAAAPVVNAASLEACFAKAIAAGNQRVSLTFTGVRFSLAGARSANPGAIYVVKRDSDTYLGKVMGNKFLATRDCTPEQSEFVADVLNDPREAAVKHGKLTGACCVCNRTLTNDDSIEAGIGPICAEKFGW